MNRPAVVSSGSAAVMSPVLSSDSAADNKPPSPPLIRRSSDRALSDLDVPTHFDFPPAPASATSRGKHRKECSWKLGDDGITAVKLCSSGEFEERNKSTIQPRIAPHVGGGTKHKDAVGSDENTGGIDHKVSATQPKYPTNNEADRESHVSRGSKSSIFASTRSKLKGYLTSYSRKKKNKGHNKGPTAVSPDLNISIRTEQCKDEVAPSALSSVKESKANSSHKEICSNSPLTPASSCIRKTFEDMTSQVSPLTPDANNDEDKSPSSSIMPSSSAKPYLPCINLFPEKVFTTRVIDLPWSESSAKGDTKLKGKYTGPVNDFLQPHGKGKLTLKTGSSQTFYGTWRDGKLVSPLTLEEEPTINNDSDKGRRQEIHPPVTEDSALAKANKDLGKVKPLVGYSIGDACRTSHDMIIHSSRHKAIESAGLLQKWDGAFIKRSCGLWKYAILVERAPQPVNIIKRRLEYSYWTNVWETDPRYQMEDSMMFVIDGNGGTKIIPKHAWAKYVRRVNPDTLPNLEESHTVQIPFRESQSRLFSLARGRPAHDVPMYS